MFDNTHFSRFLYYIPPSPASPASGSPWTLFDAHEMADLICRTITKTDAASAIAADITLNNISGKDFIDLSVTYLRTLSKDNEQVFKELRMLQKARISPDAILSASTPRTRIPSIFPDISPQIYNRRLPSNLEGQSGGANNMDFAAVVDDHNDDSVSSGMLNAQIPAFDFGDEDDSDLHIINASIYELNDSQLVKNSLGSQSASSLDGENTHLQNDPVLAGPLLYTSGTRSPPALSYVGDEDPDTATQFSQILLGNNMIPVPHTTLDPTGSNILIEQDMLPIISGPSTAVTESLTQDLLYGSPLEEFSLSCSLDNTKTMIETWETLTEEDREALEPHLPASEPAASDAYSDVDEALNGQKYGTPQSSNSSKEEPDDAIHEVDSPICSNTGSKSTPSSSTLPLESRRSTPVPEDRHDPKFDEIPQSDLHDINDSNAQYNVDGATFTLPIDIIPVTPTGSPVFDGLSQYMIPGAVLRVDQDDVSTPVQRDIPTEEPTRSSSESSRFGLPPSSENEPSPRSAQEATNLPESPEPNADAIHPDPPYPHPISHIEVRDSHLEMSTSPLERIQSGRWRLIPTFFALTPEMINRTS